MSSCWESGGPPWLFDLTLAGPILAVQYAVVWMAVLGLRASSVRWRTGLLARLPVLAYQCGAVLAVAYSGASTLLNAPSDLPNAARLLAGVSFAGIALVGGLSLALTSSRVTAWNVSAFRMVPWLALAILPAAAVACVGVAIVAGIAQSTLGHRC
jgi:hypothetical protein